MLEKTNAKTSANWDDPCAVDWSPQGGIIEPSDGRGPRRARFWLVGVSEPLGRLEKE